MKYPKINTIFKRGKDKKIINRYFSKNEFKNQLFWHFTEKIDGTNIRIEFERKIETTIDVLKNVSGLLVRKVEIKGRTDKAIIPLHLFNYLKEIFTEDKIAHTFPTANKIILYGEGYGKKIQGDKYKLGDKVKFILFDVWIDGWWLEFDNVKNIAQEFDIDYVPEIGVMTYVKALNYIKAKPKSKLNDKVIAEGYVARGYPMIMFRDGTPIMWKIKVKDYE